MASLTDVSIRSLAAPAKGQLAYFDDGLPGFGIRVSQGGARTFFVFLGKGSSRNRHSIGRYGIITLAEARTEAKRLLAQQTLGHTKPNAILFSEAQTKYEEQHFPKLKPRTKEDYKRILDTRFKKLHDKKLHEITFEDVTNITDKLVKTPREQGYSLVVVNTFFRWCVRRRYLKNNPIEGVDIPKSTSRKRVLSDDELVKIWRTAEQVPEPFSSIVRLIILWGTRRGETAALRTEWYGHNSQTLTLPSEVTKNSTELELPIGPMAIEILSKLTPEGGYYFPSGRKAGTHFTGYSKAKRELDKLLPGIKAWTLHTLRHTFSTNCARWKVAPHIKEMLLNHISSRSQVEAIYDHHSYFEDKRAALLTVEDNIKRLLAA